MFPGTEDAYNSVAACQAHVAVLKAGGADIELTLYEGGKHGFDTGDVTMQDGRHMATLDFYAYRKTCTHLGYAVGSNPRYREMSRTAVKELLTRLFSL